MTELKNVSDDRYSSASIGSDTYGSDGYAPQAAAPQTINTTLNTATVESAESSPHTLGEKEETPPTLWMVVRELTETIVLSLIIFLLMRQVVQNYRIESHSMEPNFIEGQFILVNKLAYTLGEPSRGDVLVFNNPNNANEDYIKRIIALPGDTLEIKEQQVFINDEPLDEPFIQNKISPGFYRGPDIIEPNSLFVMGDNRPNSSDSRAFGQLSQDLVVGKAWLRVWPLDTWGLINHYDLEPGVPVQLE